MNYKEQKKNLLFIESFLLPKSLIYKAQEKGYGTFVLSSNDVYLNKGGKNTMNSSTFFQVDDFNEKSVLTLAKQVNQKFFIHGVIPEYSRYNLLSAKIAYHLKKTGLNPETALKMESYHFVPYTLQLNQKEPKIAPQHYRVDGFIKNKTVYILSFTEKILSPEPAHPERGYIIRAELEPTLSLNILTCLENFSSAFKIDHGFFSAKVKVTSQEITLLKFKMNIAKKNLSALISRVTGIDYYLTIYKFFSSQPFSCQKEKKLNVAVLFFYKNFMKKRKLMQTLKDLSQQSHVLEMREYAQDQSSVLSKEKEGHVILIHEDYKTLTQHVQEIVEQS
jgi:hypothetical protein